MAISSRLALWEQKIREEDKSPPPTSPPPLFSVIPGGFIRQLVRETEKEAKEARRKRQAALASPERGAPEAAASEPDGKPRDQPSAAWQPNIPSQESGGAVPADPVPMAAINGEKPPDPPAKRPQPFRRGVRGGDVLLMVARLDPDAAKPEQRCPLRDAPACKTSAAATDPGGVQRGGPLGLPRGFQAGAEDVAPKGEKTQSGGAGYPRSLALNMDKKGQGPVGREGMPPQNKGLGAGEPQVKEEPAEGPPPAEKEGEGPPNKAAKGSMSKGSAKEAGSQRQGRKWGPSLSRRSNCGDTENQGAREAELPSQGDGSGGAGGATETGAALRVGEKAGGAQSVPGKMEGSQDVPEKLGDPQSMSKKTGRPQDVPKKPGDPQTVSKKTGGPQDVPEKPGDLQSVSKKTGGPQDVPEEPGDLQSMSKKTGGPQDVPEKPGDPQSMSKKTGGPQKVPENPGLPQSLSKKTGGSQSVSEEPGSPQSVSGEIEGPQNVSEKLKGGLSVSREAEGPQGGIELGGAPQGGSQEAAEAGWRALKDSGSSKKVRGGGEPPASAGRQGLPGVRGQEAEVSREGADQAFLEPECQVQGPELREDQDRPSGGQTRDSNQAPEDRWYEAEKVWLVQKDEFALATVLKPDEGTADLPAGRVRLCLDADKTVREVDEDHVHRANPPELDQVEDLASLISVNESSVLHTLLCRHRAQLHHTCLGPDLIVLQPQGDPSPGAGKVPALVASLARRAYRALLNQRRDQSVVALGRSGAGKTACCRQVLEQLVLMAGSVDGRVSVEKIRAAFTVLRAFGSVTTAHSRSATRFSMVMALDFSPTGRITAAQLQTFLLEKSLGARPPEGEGNFQVFSQMLAGLDLELRTELNLHQLADGNAFGMGTWATPEDKQQAAEAFARLRAAMDTLGIVGSEQQALWRVLAAIYHLGAAGTCKVGRKQFMYFEGANHAAEALGCGYEELNTATFKHHLRQIIRQVTSGTSQRHPGEEDTSPGLKMTGVECLDGVASGLYQELFVAVVSLINRSFSSQLLSVASIMVVDSAGFQNPRHQGRERAAGFEELCRNYAHERLQLLGHQRTFLSPLERAREEGVPVRFEAPELTPRTTVALLDQSPSQVRLPAAGGGAEDAGGLFWILDEEVRVEGSSDSVVLERLCAAFGKKETGAEGAPALRLCEQPLQCEIAHQLGQDPVRYDFTGWLRRAKPNLAAQDAPQLLRQSTREELRRLFGSRAQLPPLCGAVGGLEGGSQLALRRNRAVRRTFARAAAAVRRRAPCAQVSLQMDALTSVIRHSQLHFVHCLVMGPGLETRGGQRSPTPPQPGGKQPAATGTPNIPALRAQLAGSHLLEMLRAHRAGYADHMGLAQFRRKFQALDPALSKKLMLSSESVDERKAVEELLQALDLEKGAMAVGHSQVFLKAGVVSRLERQRVKLVSQVIVVFQAACRGFLSRQEFKKLKIWRLAARCIQKNMAVFLAVKDWPWWRLLGSLRPVLSASIGNEQLHAKEEELTQLRQKLEKSEKSRNELLQNADQLESKIADMTTELAEERFKGDVACQVLESERAERLRVAREIQEVKSQYEQVQETLGAVRKQLEEAQQRVQMKHLERTHAGGADEWQIRLDCVQMENEFLRKRLQQCEERLDSELMSRKELEQKLGELQSAYEGAKMVAHQLKRKCRHLTCDLEDTHLLLENQQSRNHELEKKQKKFDLQLAQALGEAVFEKGLREKLTQENSSARWELGLMQQQLEQKQQDCTELLREVERLRAHEQELLSVPALGDKGLTDLRDRFWKLEASTLEQQKIQRQQEDTIRQLEQLHQRSELELQCMKQVHQKDLEDREEELEDVRQSCQKRLQQLEVRLEQEHEEKQLVLHEKQDLEGLIGTLCDQIGHRDFDVEKRLRRDLRRTHALLSDVQQLLGTMEDGRASVSKEELDKVHSQLEQSEAKCEDALKTQKALTADLESMHSELESVTRSKSLVDEQLFRLQFERADLLKRIDEDQDDLNDLMQKHKDLITQSAADIGQIQELRLQLEEAVKEKHTLQEQLQGAQMRIQFLEQTTVDRAIVSRQEAAICDLENKTEFQKVQIKRFEVLVIRLRDSLIKMGEELSRASTAEAQQRENSQYYQRRLGEMKVEMGELVQREAEASRRCLELEKCVEELAAVRLTLQGDLETSIRRIADLQAALVEAASSDSDDESVKTAVDYGGKKETDTASSFCSQAEGSLQSWLSCTLSLPPDALRTPSRQSALSTHSLGSRLDEEAGDARRTPCFLNQAGDVRSKTSGLRSASPSSLGHQKPCPSGDGRGLRRDGRVPSPTGSDTLPSPSAALSEFVEGLRRKRGQRGGGPELGLEDWPTVPNYQTTGAASLRRARVASERGAPCPTSGGGSPLELVGAASAGKSPHLLRSSSLRCIPLGDGERSPLFPKSQKTRFSSCDSLLESTPAMPVDRLMSPTLCPRRRCLEASLEEAGFPELGKEPLVFQNRQFAHLTQDSPTGGPFSWRQRETRVDLDDFLPAIRKPGMPADGLDRPRQPSVHFETEDADCSVLAGIQTAPRESQGAREDPAHLSDSSSSSSSSPGLSFKRPGSIRPRIPRPEGDGGESTAAPQDRECGAERRDEDVESIMKKYLQK